MAEPERRAAYYSARPGGWRDWWTILHPPYTAWHLAYVVIGAALAPHVDASRLIATLLAFFAAVGVGAHALDELHSRPLRTQISSRALATAAVGGLLVAVALGVVGIAEVGWILMPFVVIGPILAVGYNLELFGGRIHTDLGFAVSWGAFPLLTAYAAQAGRLDLAAVVAAGGAVALSLAQRSLSTPARTIRRRVRRVDGTVVFDDGTARPLDEDALLAPLERALRSLSWGVVALAAGLAIARLA